MNVLPIKEVCPNERLEVRVGGATVIIDWLDFGEGALEIYVDVIPGGQEVTVAVSDDIVYQYS